MTKPHKHHDVVIAILGGKKAQYRVGINDEWRARPNEVINPLSCPSFNWRIGHGIIKAGRHEVQKAMTEAPAEGELYWTTCNGSARDWVWRNDEIDKRRLAAGEVYATKEAVVAAVAFFSKFKRGEIDLSEGA